MSDYLSNLTAKSLNQAEVLQPRLASRFESLAIAPALPKSSVWEQPATPFSEDEGSDRRFHPVLGQGVLPALIPEMPPQQQFVSTQPLNERHKSSNLEAANPLANSQSRPSEDVRRLDDSTDTNERSLLEPFQPSQVTRATPEQIPSLFAIAAIASTAAPPTGNQSDSIQPTVDHSASLVPQSILPQTLVMQSTDVAIDSASALLTSRQSQNIQPVINHLSNHPSAIAFSPQSTILQPTVIQPIGIDVTATGAIVNPALISSMDQSQNTQSQNTQSQNTQLDIQPIDFVSTIASPTQSRATATSQMIASHSLQKAAAHELVPSSTLTSRLVKPAIARWQGQSSQSEMTATDPTPPPMPTIQVSIGRIEVRATVTPLTPQKQRSTLPAMGLDDYLRQRAKGASR